jgi:hypothetical protein
VSANRYHNEVLLTEPEGIDSELLGWASEAYELTS